MSVYAWGKNSHGQLGLEREPVQPASAPSSDDEVQRGDEPKFPQRFVRESKGHKPVRVEINGEYIVGVAAGEHHTLVVTRHGDVYSSGRGKEGQLGHGEEFRLDEDVPRKVEGISHEPIKAVACGAYHSLAITSTGRLYEWGLIHTHKEWGQGSSDAELMALAGPSRARQTTNSRLNSVVADSARRWLAATDRHSDEDVTDEEDELDAERAQMQRRMLENLPQRSREAVPRLARSLLGTRVVSVSAGYAHSVAVSEDGRAFSVGQNDRGQLGLGHRIHSGIFRQVLGMDDCFVLEVACGEQHNLARASPKIAGCPASAAPAALYVWGGGRLGQLGLGAESTRLRPTCNRYMKDVGGGVVSVGAGANHSVCVVATGQVYGWGHAEYNQQGVEVVAGADLMRDDDGHSYFRVPRMVRGLAYKGVVSVCCGSNFTLAVDRNGVTYSFGWNEGDTLGRGWLGATDPSPGPISALPPVTGIAAGSRHAVVLANGGPSEGRHLGFLLDEADSHDVELFPPGSASPPGVPVHMCVISVRCPYLAGHVQAALKSDGEDEGEEFVGRQGEKEEELEMAKAQVCLEHATSETLSLLVRYLYTDEVPDGVSGEVLGTLGGLAQELLLPRLESLCVARLPYSLRRRYNLRNSQAAGGSSGAGAVVAVPSSTFVSELGGLAGSPRYSDVLLVLPDWNWEFHCHKAVLCSAPWWHALLRGGFREGGRDTMDMSGLIQEGVTRPEALEAAVRHVYTNSHDTVVQMDPSAVMEVVILSEYMVLPSLRRACEFELSRYVDMDSAPYLGNFANKYHLFKLETLCKEVLETSARGK